MYTTIFKRSYISNVADSVGSGSSSSVNHIKLILQLFLLSSCFLATNCDAINADKLELNPEGIPKSIRNILSNDLLTYKSPMWIRKEFTYSLSGYDDYNRPIWIVDFGKWDVRKMVHRGGRQFNQLDKHMNQAVYRILASRMRNSTSTSTTTTTIAQAQRQNQKNNSSFRPNEFICIWDFKTISMSQVLSIRNVRYLKNKLKSLLPTFDYAKVVYIVNVNIVGETIFRLVKPILGEIFEKAEVFDTNERDWKLQLRKVLPRDQIPWDYGGFRNSTAFQFFG